MKRLQLSQNTEEWLEWRKGKITGSRLNDIIVKRGTGRKIGFYEVIAERLAIQTDSDNEDVMQRGHDLEEVALTHFEEITGKKVNRDCGVWVSDENEHIALSPDGEISDTEACEVKCLSSAKHLQAYFEKEIPSEYEAQAMQYFIVNEKLEQLYFIFFDPRIPAKPLHVIVIDRSEYEDTIKTFKEYQEEALRDIDLKVAELSF
jgi:putative phage-type endonuclease